MGHTILITGSSGFLGSALSVDLSRGNTLFGIDTRNPSEALREAGSNVRWDRIDISDLDSLNSYFKTAARQAGGIDFVIHLAAYYHYGRQWRREYESCNVRGTRNVIEAAYLAGVKRVIFAGSIAAMEPPSVGEVLTEKSRSAGFISYAKSKAMGEAILAENSDRIPAAILRLGGVFSDWCELPPLFSIIKQWSKPGFMGCMMPGRGLSGFPYIHRHEAVRFIRYVIEKDTHLGRLETLFACENGCTQHIDLFPIIRGFGGKRRSIKPIHIPPVVTGQFLRGKHFFNLLRGKSSYERAWMMDYVDRPLVVDTSHTRAILGWTAETGYRLTRRLPLLMKHFYNHRQLWDERNIRRNEGHYEYESDTASALSG